MANIQIVLYLENISGNKNELFTTMKTLEYPFLESVICREGL